MPFIKEVPEPVFDTSKIKTGYLVYAKHASWKESIGGFVSAVNDKEVVVQYHPGIGNVTNHFIISAKEASLGNWNIRYSPDLLEVNKYPED